MTSSASASTPLADVLRSIEQAALRLANRVVSGPRWRVKALVTLLALASFMSFPSIDFIRAHWGHDATWKAVERQIAHPLTPATYAPGTHESKLAFRLTAPVILHVLGLGHAGALALQALSTVALLWLTLVISHRIMGDRALALLAAAGIATTFPGIAGIAHDYRGVFDGVAYAFVAAAIWAPAPWMACIAVILAGFTDERALLSSALVAIWWWLPSADETESRRNRRFVAAIALAWLASLAIRLWLSATFGLSTPVGTGSGVGLGMMARQLNGFPFGVWTALEALWIPVMAAVAVLVGMRQRLCAAVFAVAVAAVLVAASAVSDLTRSAAYVFPAFFVALKVLHAHEPRGRLRTMLLVSSGLAVAVPTYYTGLSEIRWLFPAPLQILRMALS